MRALGASRTSVVPGGALAGGWARDPLWKTARAVPSLDLRFADNKTLGDAYSGGSPVTFTRASSGTYVGSDGLLKTAVTNLLLRSEEFDNASWTKQSSVSVSANTTIAPDGALTADTVTADQSLGIFQSITATVGATYTNSVYIKAGTATSVMLRDDTGAGRHIVLNPSTGVITATSGTLVSSGSQALSNGWYRYFMTYVADATTVRGIIRPNSAGSAQTFIAWGAQIEQASALGDYVPTTTAINSAPRFDHNPTTGESLGLLVEEARTNLWQWSNSATDGQTWNNVGTHMTLTAGQTSPAGDSTAIRAADVDSATAGTFIQRTTVSPALTAGTFVSYSIFIKPINIPNTIGIAIFANGTTDGVTGTFTVSGTAITGFTINTSGGGGSGSASYIAYPNGWYRVIVSGIPSTVTMADCRVRINLGSYARSTGTARFDWYGGQFENNAFASSYIPTTGTAGGVTRAADVASITGSNFSSFYNQTEGTVFSSFKRISYTGTSTVVSINDNTTNNRLYNLRQDTAAALTVISATAGSVDASPSLTLSSGASADQVAVAQQLNNFGASANGGTVATDSTVLMPTVTQANIGNVTSSSFFNGTIKRLTYWPVRLANTTLQQITQP